MKKVIIDTSCLIALEKIGLLDLLPKLYDAILIPGEVAIEYGYPLPDWATIIEVDFIDTNPYLGLGELAAIHLAFHEKTLIAIDDKKARYVANQLGLNYTGTLGIIAKAKRKKLIVSALPFLVNLEAIGFYMTEDLKESFLNEVMEHER